MRLSEHEQEMARNVQFYSLRALRLCLAGYRAVNSNTVALLDRCKSESEIKSE